jgi:hypothetical protein
MTEHKIDYKFEYKPQCIGLPEQSEWTCYLFGNRPGGHGLAYIPQKGQVPNRFVRFMMRICFDCYWVKKDNND